MFSPRLIGQPGSLYKRATIDFVYQGKECANAIVCHGNPEEKVFLHLARRQQVVASIGSPGFLETVECHDFFFQESNRLTKGKKILIKMSDKPSSGRYPAVYWWAPVLEDTEQMITDAISFLDQAENGRRQKQALKLAAKKILTGQADPRADDLFEKLKARVRDSVFSAPPSREMVEA